MDIENGLLETDDEKLNGFDVDVELPWINGFDVDVELPWNAVVIYGFAIGALIERLGEGAGLGSLLTGLALDSGSMRFSSDEVRLKGFDAKAGLSWAQ